MPHAAFPVRLRAVVIGLILVAVMCALTPYNNVLRQATPLGGGHFPLAPFVALLALTVLVTLLGKIISGRPVLSGKELLLAWAMMALGSGIAYTGLVRTFLINLTAPYHFATVANRWEEVLHPLIPTKLYPQSREAVQLLYDGLAGGRDMGWTEVLQQVPWAAWLPPILAWGGFILLCYFVIVCIVNLFGRQWIQRERMNFPLLQVPLTLSEAVDNRSLGELLRNRYMLMGILIPVSLHLLNGIHFYVPTVPQIPTLILTGTYFPKYGLFSAFYKLKIYLIPAFIGFAFLAARQVSFSFWVFFLLGGLFIGLMGVLGYNIPSAALGITFGHGLTRPEETQMIGAYGVFFLFILWLARYHLLDILRQAFRGADSGEGEADLFSIPVAFWGFILGSLGIILWCAYFGMPFWAGVLTMGAFFFITIVVSRIICQGGVAYFTMTVAPIDGLLGIFGPKFYGSIGLIIAAAVQKVLFLDFREALMPTVFHTQRVSRNANARRLVLWGIVLALLVAVVVSFLAMLALCYKYGIRELQFDWASRTTTAVYESVATLVETPVRPGRWVLIFSFWGALVMLGLVTCYHRYYWWPIHPIGYLTAYSTSMRILWFSFLVGWVCNSLCMRYGGVVLFKRVRLFFIGLIIGDFCMGGAWALFGLFADASYQVLPI
jgi:hypothetical protein